MSDLSSFFRLFSGLSSGFRERAKQVDGLLNGPQTTYVLVAAASAATQTPSLDFVNALTERGLSLDAVFVNRVVPPSGLTRPVANDWMPEAPEGVAPSAWTAQLAALDRLVKRYDTVASHHADIVEGLREVTGATVYPVPQYPDGVRSLRRLASLARALPPAATDASSPDA